MTFVYYNMLILVPRTIQSEMCDAIRTFAGETFAVYNRFFGEPTRRFWRVGLPKYYILTSYRTYITHTCRDIRYDVSVFMVQRGPRKPDTRYNHNGGLRIINIPVVFRPVRCKTASHDSLANYYKL